MLYFVYHIINYREEAIDLKDKTFALLDKVKIVQENMTKKQDVLDSMNID